MFVIIAPLYHRSTLGLCALSLLSTIPITILSHVLFTTFPPPCNIRSYHFFSFVRCGWSMYNLFAALRTSLMRLAGSFELEDAIYQVVETAYFSIRIVIGLRQSCKSVRDAQDALSLGIRQSFAALMYYNSNILLESSIRSSGRPVDQLRFADSYPVGRNNHPNSFGRKRHSGQHPIGLVRLALQHSVESAPFQRHQSVQLHCLAA